MHSHLLCLLFGSVAIHGIAQVAPFPQCNVGPMHHAHLILPLAADELTCSASDARFVLSHGATFFCPHTWDIKLLAAIVEDDARATLCESYFSALAAGAPPTHSFRPMLDQGELPASALGQLTTWKSEVMYWIHSFGEDNNSGPDDGWNVTTIRSETTTITIDQVLYSRQFDLQPAPPQLTYLAMAPSGPDGPIVMSHYISTSGPSGFDHLLTVNMSRADQLPLALRSTWPLYLTVPSLPDSMDSRLRTGKAYAAELHVYDETFSPSVVAVEVQVVLDYYAGVSDGFAGFGTICPDDQGPPWSPTMCLQ